MAEMSDEDLAMRADEITDESLESTRRMLQMTEESRQAGVKTLDMLDDQGHQLNRVEKELDKIDEDMKDAEKYLKKLAKCCGLCMCPCDKQENFEETEQYKKAYGKEQGSDMQVMSHQPHGSQIQQQVKAGGAQGPVIQRVTNDAREDEMEENLQMMGNYMGDLKSMALSMGTEIDKQNVQIDRITEKTDTNKARIDEARRTADKLLGK
ncbi:synaptosomal-associated protein 23-like isoform X2 [Erpetoichthys calabaricus]|uniref:Synaptosomal-associated protein n=1 Tax=Erpetoichthys calabaricus TaxID=27687 RepID=A0A8C4RDT4_ERPCA|nr:synaptosomal-associated protein 23-like isoform X2 [Erpetoichthys calabaricus]